MIVGVSLKKINESLNNLDLSLDNINGILITHEHSDHTLSLGTISRKYNIPIYSNKETALAIKNVNLDNFNYFKIDEEFWINDLQIKPFSIPHDAANPCGFSIYNSGKKITIATDLGHMNNYLLENLKYSNLLLLESNYEPEMLSCSKYPFSLKQRISGPKGHLPNSIAGQTISYLYDYNLETVLLGHLSKESNIPELAYQSVISELHSNNIDLNKINIGIASRDKNGELIKL